MKISHTRGFISELGQRVSQIKHCRKKPRGEKTVLRDIFSLAKMVEMFRVTEDNEKIMQLRLPWKLSRVMACARVKSWKKDSVVVNSHSRSSESTAI